MNSVNSSLEGFVQVQNSSQLSQSKDKSAQLITNVRQTLTEKSIACQFCTNSALDDQTVVEGY